VVAENRTHPSLAAGRARQAGDVEGLLDLLSGSDRRGRVSAAWELGELRDHRAVEGLIGSLSARDDIVKMAALKALGKIGDTSAAEHVAAMAAEDQSALVRSSAAEALGAFGDPREADALVCVLTTTSREGRHVRAWAAEQLSQLGAVDTLGEIEAARRRSWGVPRWRMGRAARRLRRLASGS
jgi:HEAT repeat protein